MVFKLNWFFHKLRNRHYFLTLLVRERMSICSVKTTYSQGFRWANRGLRWKRLLKQRWWGVLMLLCICVKSEHWICLCELNLIEQSGTAFAGGRRRGGGKAVTGANMEHGKRRPRNELRDKSQIVKERTKRAAKKAYQQHRTERRRKRKGLKSRFQRKQ